MNTAEQLSAACPVCESADTRLARVRSAFWHNDRLVVIEDVPALVCNTCGEQFYDDAAVLMIDRMRRNGFPPEDAVRELRVPVFAFDNIDVTDVPPREASSVATVLASEVLIRS
jgi:YgiT-type zinc finger domain-containing protein